MHELGLALEVVEIATRKAEGARITKIVLEVGALAAVMPDALRSAFELAAAGSTAEGATLEIRELPGKGRCRTCGSELTMNGPLGACGCGGIEIDCLEGMDLRVKEMEVI